MRFHPFMHMNDGFGWVHLLVGGLFWLGLLGLLVWAVLLFSRRPSAQVTYQPPPQLSALDIIQQRYARGEIDATTFDEMRRRLTNDPGMTL